MPAPSLGKRNIVLLGVLLVIFAALGATGVVADGASIDEISPSSAVLHQDVTIKATVSMSNLTGPGASGKIEYRKSGETDWTRICSFSSSYGLSSVTEECTHQFTETGTYYVRAVLTSVAPNVESETETISISRYRAVRNSGATNMKEGHDYSCSVTYHLGDAAYLQMAKKSPGYDGDITVLREWTAGNEGEYTSVTANCNNQFLGGEPTFFTEQGYWWIYARASPDSTITSTDNIRTWRITVSGDDDFAGCKPIYWSDGSGGSCSYSIGDTICSYTWTSGTKPSLFPRVYGPWSDDGMMLESEADIDPGTHPFIFNLWHRKADFDCPVITIESYYNKDGGSYTALANDTGGDSSLTGTLPDEGAIGDPTNTLKNIDMSVGGEYEVCIEGEVGYYDDNDELQTRTATDCRTFDVYYEEGEYGCSVDDDCAGSLFCVADLADPTAKYCSATGGDSCADFGEYARDTDGDGTYDIDCCTATLVANETTNDQCLYASGETCDDPRVDDHASYDDCASGFCGSVLTTADPDDFVCKEEQQEYANNNEYPFNFNGQWTCSPISGCFNDWDDVACSPTTYYYEEDTNIWQCLNKFADGEDCSSNNQCLSDNCAYADADGDDYSASITQKVCISEADETDGKYLVTPSSSLDCDDTDASVNPDADDICNGIDDDCDSSTADGSGEPAPNADNQNGVCSGAKKYCDGTDGWRNPWDPITRSWVSTNNYESTESSCDYQDNDCDGDIDEDGSGTALGLQTRYYHDRDGDNYGNKTDSSGSFCPADAPSGNVTDNTDCDDSDSDNYPGNTESCDYQDNDCDGDIDEDVRATLYEPLVFTKLIMVG